MAKQRIIAGLVVLLAQAGFSQPMDQEKLDRYFQSLEVNDKFMGNIVVYKNGEKWYSFSSGFSNIEMATPACESTLYRIGSISKTVTATLVLKAAEEGKLELTQSIATFFPGLEHARQITIQHLLHHRSGLHNFTGDADYAEWCLRPRTEKEVVDRISQGGSDFMPGSMAQYSNSNYVLLSYLLEHVYEKTYADILKEQILEPFQLTNMRFGDPPFSGTQALSYRYEAGWHEEVSTDLSIAMGAGGIVSTASDLARFAELLFDGKIIEAERVNQMASQLDGYGMGLFEMPFGERISYGHDGKIDGFSSVFSYFPEEEVAYVLLANATNYEINQISLTVLSAVFHQPFDVPVFNAYVVSPDDLLPILGIYTSEESPLVITISKKDSMLLAQPEGQQIYAMEATGKNRFRHDLSGVTLQFIPQERKMVMTQGNRSLVFTRE